MRTLLLFLALCSTAFAQFGLRSPGFVAGTMVPPPVAGGAAIPGVYSISTNAGNATFLEVTNDAGSGANRLRLAFCSSYTVSATNPFVVYDGTTKMNVFGAGTNISADGTKWMSVHYLVAPAEGSSVLHLTNNYDSERLGIYAVTITNAAQSATFNTFLGNRSDANYLTNTTESAATDLNLAFGGLKDMRTGDTVTNHPAETLIGYSVVETFYYGTALTTQPGHATSVTNISNWSRAGNSALISFGVKSP